MRTVVAALLASVAFSAHADFSAAHQVNLDTPGALERVQRDNPTHFRAISEILREAPYRQPQALSGWVRTAFDAKMASAMLIKTSYPPRARLEFVLDDTQYRALVTLRNVEPSVTPAR